MSLSVDFLGVRLRNRAVLASGILGVSIASLKKVYESGAGIVTTKSVGPKKRKGHRAPVVFDWGGGLVNAVGLSNPGIDEFVSRFDEKKVNFPLIISLFGEQPDDFAEIVQRLDRLKCSFLELNLSCPNVLDEFGTPFSYSPSHTARITKQVKASSRKPVIVKLSANTPELPAVARSAEEAGADALCITNTIGPGMVIDIHTGAPVLAHGSGGLSGEAILPLTVRSVYGVYRSVRIPIIATGGISDAGGALQVIMAGAVLFGIGSGVYTEGLSVFKTVNGGIELFMEKNGITFLDELVGRTHRKKKYTFLRIAGNTAACGNTAHTETRRRRPEFTVVPVENIHQTSDTGARTLFFRLPTHPPDISQDPASGKGKKSRYDCREAEPIDPAPGQFYMLWLPGIDQKPFSVSFFDGESVGFSLIQRGPFSRALFKVRKGDPVGLLGPLGRGFDLQQDRYLLVGGGIGCSPLVFAAIRLSQMGKRFVFVAGGSSAESVCWIESLFRRTGMTADERIKYCTEDGSLGSKGLITDYLEKNIEEADPVFALICGPEIFIKKSCDIFRARGIGGQAGIERLMKCGIGICGSCAVDGTGDRVCTEGPVFAFEALDSLEEFGMYRRDESGSVVKDV